MHAKHLFTVNRNMLHCRALNKGLLWGLTLGAPLGTIGEHFQPSMFYRELCIEVTPPLLPQCHWILG